MIVILALAIIILLVFGSIAYFDHRDARRHAQERERMDSLTRQISAWAREETELRRAVRSELNDLSWPELRAVCEAETGRTCECSKRWNVVENVFWIRLRRRLEEQ